MQEQTGKFFSDLVTGVLTSLVPGSGSFLEIATTIKGKKGPLKAGDALDFLVRDRICDLIPGSSIDFVRFSPILGVGGTPYSDGHGCPTSRKKTFSGKNTTRPDFLFSKIAPTELRKGLNNDKAFLVGDIKLSTKTLVNDYAGRKGNKSDKRNQFHGITNFARRYQYVPATLFFTFYSGGKELKAREKILKKEFIARGVIATIASLF